MNTRSTQSGAAWLPIIIVLAIIVIGAGAYMYSQKTTDGTETPPTATSTADVMDQGANVSGAIDATDVATSSDAVVN